MVTKDDLQLLKVEFSGELYDDKLLKRIYATDASVYRKLPLAVAYPKEKEDLEKLISFASRHRISLIPRAAGTSLAGQCVGDGIIVDISKHFTRILAFDEQKKTVKVEPGVIRDELNEFLKPFGLFFGPNTSTSNRCMIGGMVGNNSSGTTSIQYGVTRDKVLEINAYLSDGTEVCFGELDKDAFKNKLRGNSVESKVYQLFQSELSKPEVREEIQKEFPKKSIHRRNHGYALDSLAETSAFTNHPDQFNLSKLICGSEGTLALMTDITLQLDDLPPSSSVVVAAHFSSIQESLEAVIIAMKHNLYTCELMDKTILDCTKNNREQSKNRFFVEGDPQAILMLEVRSEELRQSEHLADLLVEDLKSNKFGYAYPQLTGKQISQASDLRKAGLGLLGNIIGDRKAVACIEDTAVELESLPQYISEFTNMMEKFGQDAVYYAHAGAGELHLRPILNLKKTEDIGLFREITTEVSRLVKKYKGSMSGEHGDGIVRSEFISDMVGEKNYGLIRKVKSAFDPDNLFNRGKIVDPWPMDQSLRYEANRQEPAIETFMDFSDSMGILRAAEKCNGSGDCRKPPFAGGTMCPSYRATRDEKDSTRARANALREFLTHPTETNPFNSEELKQVFDLCLSCKACASECPSNVDVAAFKAEFLYQYQKANGVSFRTKMFAENAKWNEIGALFPWLTNGILNTRLSKKLMGIAPQRKIPALSGTPLNRWVKKQGSSKIQESIRVGQVYLFIDEFSNFYETEIGKECVRLLDKLGYEVLTTAHVESGRSYISKGLLDQAKKMADQNISIFKDLISEEIPLIGIEPSAILSFRDEYLRLAKDAEVVKNLARNVLTIEEFISREVKKGRISSKQFTNQRKRIKIHGHCQQKSLSNIEATFQMLNLPLNYEVSIMNTGCCGMAGSFGYEKEHYEISMKVGEESLFPKIRNSGTHVEISAAGTSCRHQIMDGTNRVSKHPISLLAEALK